MGAACGNRAGSPVQERRGTVWGVGTTAEAVTGGASAGEAVRSHRRRWAGVVGLEGRMRTDTRQRRAGGATRDANKPRCEAATRGDGCRIGQAGMAAHPPRMGRQQAISAPYTCFSVRPAAGSSARAHGAD